MKTRALSALASELVRAGLEGMAARGHDGAHKLKGGDGPMSQGGGEPLDPSPRLNASGESASNVNGKDRGTMKAPVSDARGNVRQTTASLEVLASVASLPVGRGMIVARSAEPQSARHAPVSATIIPLATNRAHRSHSAKSGSARATKNKMAQMTQSF